MVLLYIFCFSQNGWSAESDEDVPMDGGQVQANPAPQPPHHGELAADGGSPVPEHVAEEEARRERARRRIKLMEKRLGLNDEPPSGRKAR